MSSNSEMNFGFGYVSGKSKVNVTKSLYRPITEPEGSRRLRSQIPRQSACEWGKVVSLTPPLVPPSGIEPATSRFVVQCLNQVRHRMIPLERILLLRWRYSPPGWALAPFTIRLQASRSLALSLHSFIPMCQMSNPWSFVFVGYSLRSEAYCKVS